MERSLGLAVPRLFARTRADLHSQSTHACEVWSRKCGDYGDTPAMLAQDANDLVAYLENVAKGFSVFSLGINKVGGETNIAVVTRRNAIRG